MTNPLNQGLLEMGQPVRRTWFVGNQDDREGSPAKAHLTKSRCLKIEIKMSDTGTARSSETQALLELGNLPLQFLDAALGLLECPSKLVRIKSNTTLGTGITIAFEPTGVLLACDRTPDR